MLSSGGGDSCSRSSVRTCQALNCFQHFCDEVVNVAANRVVIEIAVSVTKDGRIIELWRPNF
ncbi:hypothetical protein HID58_091734 [Brassica napus]|uniref:Uncharacterized protein n=1 Tax=Brassica napus TaxID=3708 RepID=A0ABQ7WYT8_BRANA|nr:hypothetical protein HID58_091734 [Brassica napus]